MVKHKNKVSRCVCIFCGFSKNTNPIFIPPLEYTFRPVCNNCLPTLDRFKKKYPELWE